jgi:hypothetical protein
MLLSAFPAQATQAQGAYSEKLSVFVAGSDAMWYFTYGGINVSSELSALESTPGLSWYNLTAISTTGMFSDMQIFGPGGYNLLPVPFIPSQGMFLTVGSDSFSDASAAATALDSYMLTHFASFSNGTSEYTFYSPVSFGALIPSTLFKLIPSSEGGFAGALTSSFFVSSPTPFIVLEGQKTASGFSHTLVVGSISSSALNGSDEPNLLAYFSSTATSLTASNHSASSVVQLTFLDGVIASTDSATISNNDARFTGSYTLNLGPGKSLYSINATVIEQPVPLLAYREVNVGVLRTGDNMSVTLVLKNLSPSDTITGVNFSDNWWNSTSVFKLLQGSTYTVPAGSIQAGASITPVYRLQYTGTGAGTMTIPASVIRYQYVIGGVTFNATAVLNPIRLSLGEDEAIVLTTATPVGGLDKPVGEIQKYNVTATNVGTLPASDVIIAGRPVAGLAARTGSSPGGSVTVTVEQTASGILAVNSTQAFTTTYQDPSGYSLNSTSNVLSNIFSHSSMNIGFPRLNVGAQLASLANQETNLTLTFTTTNPGFANVTNFRATGSLPPGLGCGTVSGIGFACSGNQVTISYPLVNSSYTYSATMKYNLTSPVSYLMGPMAFEGVTSGNNVTGMSNPLAIPGGLTLSKQFVPSMLFGGMSSQVTVSAVNSGPFQLYNMTVGSKEDTFDTLASSATLTKTSASVAAGGNLTDSYLITASQIFGNLTGTPTTATFFFGGVSFTLDSVPPRVEVYQPLSATISTYPSSPEEGKNFTITFSITNPSGVSVSNVLFKLPVPSGLGLSDLRNAQVSGGLLSVRLNTLAADSTATATVSAVASSGISIPFANAVLTFNYAGSTVNGVVPTNSGIAIGEDITTRYLIPMAFVFFVLLFAAYYLRRMAAPTARASQK